MSLTEIVFGKFNYSWRIKSILILSLLLGFYITNNLVSYFIDKNVNSFFIVFFLVFISELVIRSRYSKRSIQDNIILIIFDNFRIGSTYALILEAFKLGS